MTQGETITAVCDLDKNTVGATTKEGSRTHTHTENKQDVNMLSLAGDSPDTMQTIFDVQL